MKIKKMYEDAQLPQYKTEGSVGADAYAYLNSRGFTRVYPGRVTVVGTGVAVQVPSGYELQVRPRSGLATKGLTIINSPGTVDEDYRGEVKIILTILGETPMRIDHGDRIAQFIIAPVRRVSFELVEDLEETERGEGGLGSTGV